MSATRRAQAAGEVSSAQLRHRSPAPSAKPGVIVTTSWDDGHRMDVRLADLLIEYQVPATFYISPFDAEFKPEDRLPSSGITDLAEHFEIGAHTLTHPQLTNVSDSAARDEIEGSKKQLEDITGRPVDTFCYPRGAYNETHVRMVRDAGFSYARTVQRFSLDAGSDALTAPTTVHAYHHLVDIPQAVAYGKLNPFKAWDVYSHWDRLAERLFDQALENGGVYHLWGHSWEVDGNNDWAALRRVLDYISRRPEVSYRVNGRVNDDDIDDEM